MNEKKTIVMAVHNGANIIDITGPMEIFTAANEVLRKASLPPGYDLHVLGEESGMCKTFGGLSIYAEGRWTDWSGDIDTLLVAGGPEFETIRDKRGLIDWVKLVSPSVRRVASICTGAFILAEAGLLKGRTATTHWLAVEKLAEDYPDTNVLADPIYTTDGGIYCSAGVTAGMDLALALVEEDLGKETALMIAKLLVMYLKRPGGQSQFSIKLREQSADDSRLSGLLKWLDENYKEQMNIEKLAEMSSMSLRTFNRCFKSDTGLPPAKYIEYLRLEKSLEIMEKTEKSFEETAYESGFTSPEQFRRAFIRRYKVTPSEYRSRFL
jgi:transcriptional regulator GlxA family with amidase domain